MTTYYKLSSGNFAMKIGPGDYAYATDGGWVRHPELMRKIEMDGDADQIPISQAKAGLKSKYPGTKFFQ